MLLFGKNLEQQRSWIVVVSALFGAASAWFFWDSLSKGQWLGGSSLPGFVFGVAAGLIIIFECLLWLRKYLRAWRIGRVQAWMRAHIWLGLLCLPLAIYHSGFRFGGTLSTLLMVLLLVVVASGIWGLAMQQWLPRRLYEEVPAETIYAQIPHLVGLMKKETDQLVHSVCGPAPGETLAPATPGEGDGTSHLVLGAVRTVGKVQGKVVETRVFREPVPNSEPLRTFYQDAVVPFLEGKAADSPLWNPTRAAAVFQDLRTRLPIAAHSAVDTLADCCGQRCEWEEQARLYRWLHNWLWIHLPLSLALLVLLLVHIYGAIKYW